MPKKTLDSNFNAIHNNQLLTYELKAMSKVFKNFSNLPESFLAKQPDPSNKYNLESVFLYHSNLLSLRCLTLKVLLKKNFSK